MSTIAGCCACCWPRRRDSRRQPSAPTGAARVACAALARRGALALTLGSPLLPAVAASPQPTTWIAVADRAADNMAQPADDALLRALLNRSATTSQATAVADRAASPASDALLRALLNRAATTSQAAAASTQDASPVDDALAQAELTAGAT